jgi:alpha-glucosidase
MIDQVLSHTSIEHAWFREPPDRSNPKADWYVWTARGRHPPNNWLSLFGGCAWQWEPRREQYYLHNFLVDQPDLNFHHPDVQQATLDNVRFWLDRGVDGFRLDAINFCFHDAQLRDNPAKPADKRVGAASAGQPVRLPVPLLQQHAAGEPAVPGAPARAAGRIPGAVSLGEISSEDSLATTAEYTRDGRLHMGYSFELLVDDYSAATSAIRSRAWKRR